MACWEREDERAWGGCRPRQWHGKEQRGKGERHWSKREASPYRWWAKPTTGDISKPRAKPQTIFRITVTCGEIRAYGRWDKMKAGKKWQKLSHYGADVTKIVTMVVHRGGERPSCGLPPSLKVTSASCAPAGLGTVCHSSTGLRPVATRNRPVRGFRKDGVLGRTVQERQRTTEMRDKRFWARRDAPKLCVQQAHRFITLQVLAQFITAFPCFDLII
jgi:hypothetical protein